VTALLVASVTTVADRTFGGFLLDHLPRVGDGADPARARRHPHPGLLPQGQAPEEDGRPRRLRLSATPV